MKTKHIKHINSYISVFLVLSMLISAFSSTLAVSAAEGKAKQIDSIGEYNFADFSKNRLYSLNGTKLYLYDFNYGSGYEVYDYCSSGNPQDYTILDAKVQNNIFYALFSDSERCYFHSLNYNNLQMYSIPLNFNCEKFTVLENGDYIISLNMDGTDYVFVLETSGMYKFYPTTQHIEEFYGSSGTTVYYKTSSGLSYGECTDSGFTQSKSLVSGITPSDFRRANYLDIFNGFAATDKGKVYTVSGGSEFSNVLDLNRSGYTESIGAMTVTIGSSGYIVGADGDKTLTAYDTVNFDYYSSVSTEHTPYFLFSDGSSIFCLEKENGVYYYEVFDITDFVYIEPEMYNLNNEAVYSSRTGGDIAKLYSEAVGGKFREEDVLAQQGSLSAPYGGTLIKSDVQSTLIDFSNYLRFLCGLSGYSYGGDETSSTVGKGAVLLSTVWRKFNVTGHTPGKPSDMDNDFYTEAYSACGGNISYGYGNTLWNQVQAIRSLNDDLYNASNVETNMGGYHQGYNTPGHRNSFLQRGGSKLTYGYADCVLLQYYEYAQNDPNASGTIRETGNNEAAYAWPAPGAFPAEEISPGAIWTIYFNTDKLDIGIRTPKVTITDLQTGESFVRDTEMHDADGQREGYSTSSFWGKCLSFTPPDTDSYAGKSYRVTVENLINDVKLPATVEYTVNFFDYNGEFLIDGSIYSMDHYGNLTYISTPTEPTTAEITTAEPTTEEPTTAEPTTAEPTTEEPTEEPTTVQSTTEQPTTAEPATEQPTTEPVIRWKIGDINGDGSIDVGDAILVRKYSASKTEFDERQMYVADVNDDKTVDILDATYIQKFAVQKIFEFIKQQ